VTLVSLRIYLISSSFWLAVSGSGSESSLWIHFDNIEFWEFV
jgi:hypothetical protein